MLTAALLTQTVRATKSAEPGQHPLEQVQSTNTAVQAKACTLTWGICWPSGRSGTEPKSYEGSRWT